MKNFWKNVLNAVKIIVISGGVAAVTTVFVIKNTERKNKSEMIFNQPFQTTTLNSVAAENIDFTYAAEKTVNAVVHIVVTISAPGGRRYTNPFEEFFGYGDRQQRPRQRTGSGSGVIISTDGYIITNNHVVENADTISVTLNDKRNFKAKVIATDALTDVALIKIEVDDLQPIPFGDSDQLKIGEWVLAVGNPFNLTSTVTAGIVSAKGRSSFMQDNNDRERIEAYIQTDAAVNQGNSGGALVNTRGELVGINTAIMSQTGMFSGYSFAIPINMAARVVNDLKQYGSLQRAMLGVQMLPESQKMNVEDPKVKVLEGAYVIGFSERSSAKEVGIEIGDVITAINSNKVTSPSNLREQIMKYHVGDKVKVKIDRYGTEKEFTVELRNLQGNLEIMKAPNIPELLGASFKSLSDREKREYGINYGIQVSDITRGKFRDENIRDSFIILVVNEQRINTPEDFYGIVEKILGGKTEDKGLFIKGFYPNSTATRHYSIDLVD